MASYDNAYSRLVASLKVVLPLVALALLSTLFLLSRSIDPDGAIPYAQVDVEELAREQRLTGATFSGVAEDGTAFSVSAARAQPDLTNINRMSATELQATLDLEDGTSVRISASEGSIDTGEGQAVLEGEVRIDTNIGYAFSTERVEAALDSTHVVANTPVRGAGPIGTLEAGRMEMTRTAREAPFLIVFNDRVKLVYAPGDEGGGR